MLKQLVSILQYKVSSKGRILTFCTLSNHCGIAYLITKQLFSFQVGKFVALLCSALGPVKISRCPEGTHCQVSELWYWGSPGPL